ncbi:hypothetical protein IWQ55_000316 [Labrenzia sp. EL_208]|nr:hypothetical protein [Labrenzia sp. EL_132]MBG6227124.1 hypothetical protein [Labrenzia sp. EL_208]
MPGLLELGWFAGGFATCAFLCLICFIVVVSKST